MGQPSWSSWSSWLHFSQKCFEKLSILLILVNVTGLPVTVMTSSTEVECRGLVTIGKENLWHLQLQKELGMFKVDEPTTIYEDNTASITMASDLSTPHKRSKHFGIEWSFFKESVENREIIPVYVSTDEQPADMLTKALTTNKFAVFREIVMGSQHLQNHFTKNSLVSHWVEEEVVNGQRA